MLAMIALAALASLRPVAAGAAASDWVETEQTAVRLISASETTGNGPLLLGLQFRMQPGWKVYWRSPGDAGFPPEPDWAGSRNLRTAFLLWPAPLRFSVLGLETLGYKDEVVLPVTVKPLVASDGVGLKTSVRYLTCNKICIPCCHSGQITSSSVQQAITHLLWTPSHKAHLPQLRGFRGGRLFFCIFLCSSDAKDHGFGGTVELIDGSQFRELEKFGQAILESR